MFKKITRLGLLLPMLWLANTAFAAPVAYVHEIEGSADVRTGHAPATTLKAGDTVEQGASVATGGNGKITIKFQDGQLVALQPNTRFDIRTYQYNTASVKESSISFAMLKGALRFVTGVIGATNHRAFRLDTPTATIGIRGTDGVVSFDESTGKSSAASSQGTLEFNTDQGTALIPPNTFSTGSMGTPPSPPAPLIQGPPSLVQNFTQLGQRSMPSNTPVSVDDSAKAAAAKDKADKADKQSKDKPTAENKKAADAAEDAADAAERAAKAAAAKAADDAKKAGAVTPTPPTSSDSNPTLGTSTGQTSSDNTNQNPAGPISTPTTTGSSGAGGGSGGGGAPASRQ